MTKAQIRAKHCGLYGQYNYKSHACIKGIEGMKEMCLKCKEVK